MGAKGGELLPVPEYLYSLLAAVGSKNNAGDLGERLIRAQQEGALGRHAEAKQHVPALLEMLARERLDCIRGFEIEDIYVARRNPAGEQAGAVCIRPGLFPHPHLFGGDGMHCLPAGQAAVFVVPIFAVLFVDRRLFPVERNRCVAGADQLQATRGCGAYPVLIRVGRGKILAHGFTTTQVPSSSASARASLSASARLTCSHPCEPRSTKNSPSYSTTRMACCRRAGKRMICALVMMRAL